MGWRPGALAVGLASSALALAAQAAAEEPCRQGLILALDVSASVDDREYRLQSGGLAWALHDAEVRQAFLARPEALVHLAVFEWSAARCQRLLVDWVAVTDAEGLDRVAAVIEGNPSAPEQSTTGIGGAMLFAAALFASGPDCDELTLDVSGDGQNNDWPRPEEARNDGCLAHVGINGLVIGAGFPSDHVLDPNRMGALTPYHRTRVINGASALVETAEPFRNFGATMQRKLVRALSTAIVEQTAPETRPRLADVGISGAGGRHQ